MSEPEGGAVATPEAGISAESAGTLLRRAREAAGLHVASLAVALKVPVRIHFFMVRAAAVAAVFIANAVHAAETAAQRFAAPAVASSLPSGGASGIGQVTFALLLVLAAVFGVAWMLKRLRVVTGAGANGIEVLSQVSLGAKERAVIIRVGNERLLLGVASGQVSLLHDVGWNLLGECSGCICLRDRVRSGDFRRRRAEHAC